MFCLVCVLFSVYRISFLLDKASKFLLGILVTMVHNINLCFEDEHRRQVNYCFIFSSSTPQH